MSQKFTHQILSLMETGKAEEQEDASHFKNKQEITQFLRIWIEVINHIKSQFKKLKLMIFQYYLGKQE